MNPTNITDWIQENIVVVILTIIGVVILSKSSKGAMSAILSIVLVAFIGLIFIGGAEYLPDLGDTVAKSWFGGN